MGGGCPAFSRLWKPFDDGFEVYDTGPRDEQLEALEPCWLDFLPRA
jgi:hypothetical protein